MKSQVLRSWYRRVRAFASAPRLQVQRTVVLQSEITPCENPVIVIACHRSGTSLLRRILNSHPNIACPPETFFLSQFAQLFGDAQAREGLGGMVGADAVDAQIRAMAFQFHNSFSHSAGKARWADKTPAYVECWPELVALAPAATKWVVIVRDPFDVGHSIYSRNWFIKLYGDRPEAETDIFENTLCYLEEYFGKLANFIDTGLAHVLRYEALVTKPEETLRPLFAALDEPWDIAVMKPWLSQHNFGIEDPIARGTKGFVPSIGNWKSFTPAQQEVLLGRLGALRARLGYHAE